MTICLTTERIVAGIAILLTLMICSKHPCERADGNLETTCHGETK